MYKKKWVKSPYEKKPGIYKMTNVITHDFYIGSTNNIWQRYYDHWARLKENKHDNSLIRNDSIKHGRESFIFEVLEYCSIEDRYQREQYYVDLFMPSYNRWAIVKSAKGFKHSSDSIAKMIKNRKGVRDEESRRKKLKEAWAKRRYKPETIALLEKMKRTGISHTPETLELMRLNRKGKPKSESFKEKTRQRRLGTKLINGKFVKIQSNEES